MSAVRKAICEHLKADTGAGKVMELASGVYPKSAPKEADHPLVIVRAHKPPKGSYVFQALSHEDSVYLVAGVTKDISAAVAAELKKRIRARLHDAPLTVTGYTVQLVSWVQDVEYTERDEDGETFQIEGSLYEVWVEPS